MPYTKRALWITSIIAILALMLSIGSAIFLSAYQASKSQHEWCDVLSVITQTKPTPAHVPFKVYHRQLHLYNDLRKLRIDFGCE